MNTKLWGCALWRLMTDVGYRADRVQDTRVLPYVSTWYQSLAFLLPCKYCRQSYRQFVRSVDVRTYTQQRRLVEWVWKVKELVNDKLHVPESGRLSHDVFERRVNSMTHSAHPDDLFDFLAILGLNYNPQDALKRKYMTVFHAVLSLVLPYANLIPILERNPLKPTDLVSRASYLDYVYRLRSAFHRHTKLPPLPPQGELWKRYENVRAENKQPIPCQYVVDDPTTWTSEFATQCFVGQSKQKNVTPRRKRRQ